MSFMVPTGLGEIKAFGVPGIMEADAQDIVDPISCVFEVSLAVKVFRTLATLPTLTSPSATSTSVANWKGL